MGRGGHGHSAKDLTLSCGWANLPRVDPAPLSFSTRLWFAWVCFFRALFDGAFAARAFAVREAMPALPAAPVAPEPKVVAAVKETAAETPAAKGAKGAKSAKGEEGRDEKASVTPALQLLALFQREGRLVDFLEQDVASFSDAEVGAAARVVHEGCRKALRQHAKIAAVRGEEEGARVTIADGYDAQEVKLIGNVQGKPPYSGVLQHRGWRVKELSVPVPTKDHDATVIAPAEVEL